MTVGATRSAKYLLGFLGMLAMFSSASAEMGVQTPRDAANVFVTATAAGDAESIAALYAQDAIMLAPGLAPIAGRAAIASVFRRNFGQGQNRIAFTNVRAETGADRAAVLWEWQSQIAAASGAVQMMNGRSLVYFRKDGDRWLISADMMQLSPVP